MVFLDGGDYLNEYYIVSEAESRKLLNVPEVVGYEVYDCLIPSTSQMLYYLKEQKKVTTANILSILRGALNYPLEESCYREHGAKLRNIIIFTIGGTKGIEILEKLAEEIREFWPEFEGFITVYYEGIFSTYQDKGVSGINLPDVDFYWKGGIVAPEFRRETLSMCSPLFEKCIIYDGGARRYEIHEHVEEVLEFWEGIRDRADQIDFAKLLEEKLGYELPVSYEDWIHYNHYEKIRPSDTKWLYRQEQGYVESMKNITLKELAEQRIGEFMIRLNLFYLAILVLGLNIWTTNDNALYSSGLGLANIFNQKKKPMVLIAGIVGTLLSVWLYYNFCNWLNVLNCTLPPVGIILVISYFMNQKDYEKPDENLETVNWFAVAGVVIGAIVANVVSWGIASINGMVVAAVCYVIGQMVRKNEAGNECIDS